MNYNTNSHFFSDKIAINENNDYDSLYNKINDYISQLFKINNNWTPNEIYIKLLEQFNELISNDNLLNIVEASEIDKLFFGMGGNRWLNSFARPSEDEIIEFNNSLYIAKNCNIFTFNMIFYKELTDDEFSNYNLDIENHNSIIENSESDSLC